MAALICHALLKLMGGLSLSEQLLRRCELGREEKRGREGEERRKGSFSQDVK